MLEYSMLTLVYLNDKIRTYLKIWLILDFGIENLRKTLIKRIIMRGLGDRRIDR